MGSMFGGFGSLMNDSKLGQVGAVQSVGGVGSTLFGGFPGVFPGMGPGQSGAIGLVELQKAQERCIREKTCPVTYGPPATWL